MGKQADEQKALCPGCGGFAVHQQTRRLLDGELTLQERPGRFRSGGGLPLHCMRGPWGYLCVKTRPREHSATTSPAKTSMKEARSMDDVNDSILRELERVRRGR